MINFTPEDQELLVKAHEAASKAFAPYSDFKVGSAVRMSSGAIVLGSNQENIAYPSGLWRTYSNLCCADIPR